MKLGVLFSGGKDSTYALSKAMEKEEVACLISVLSKNKESYMFHTPNIEVTSFQAEAIGLPMIQIVTEGKKEEELEDLEDLIEQGKEEFNLEGIVTGAIESVYQAERIQRICAKLDLWCFNPLWKKDQGELVKEVIKNDFDVIISGIFAYPLDDTWLGKKLDKKMLKKLLELNKKYKISPSGEGGELETTVLDAPFFRKKIRIIDHETESENNSGVYIIKEAKLVDK